MSTIGVYADLPLPSEWLPVLEGLRPVAAPLMARPLPSLGALVDACLGAEGITPERRSLIWARLEAGCTLQEVGEQQGITRERVRQVTLKVTRSFVEDARLRLVLDGVLTGLGSKGAVLVDIRQARSEQVPSATPEQLWNFMIEVWRLLKGKTMIQSVATPTPGIFVFTQGRLLAEFRIKDVMTSTPAFRSAEELAQELEVSVTDLSALVWACNNLKLTESGLYGWAGWAMPPLMQATAEQLAHAGFTEWHYSEIGKAIAFFNPALSAVPSRNFATVLARPEVEQFEYAGRKGHWRLRSLGDGYTDNQAALVAILSASDIPLHWADIRGQLGRNVQKGTVIALLNRAEVFAALGRGIYSLKEKSYPETWPEDEFMARQLAAAEQASLPAQEVFAKAVAAGLDPQRLKTLGRISQHFVYLQHRDHEAFFITPKQARYRRFQRWFYERDTRPLPDQDVLAEGMQAAFERRDRVMLRDMNVFFDGRQLAPPAPSLPWLEWATHPSSDSFKA